MLVMGAGVMIGEAVFGMYGPFLFNRFGLHDAVAALCGVLLGATLGFGVAAAVSHFYRRHEPATGTLWHRITASAHVHAHLRA